MSQLQAEDTGSQGKGQNRHKVQEMRDGIYQKELTGRQFHVWIYHS